MGLQVKTRFTLEDDVTTPAQRAKTAIVDFGQGSEKALIKLKNTISVVNATGIVFLTKEIMNLARASTEFGKSIIDTASNMEQYAIQLQAISKSESEARGTFLALREFARTSPLETEDVVQSYVRLRAVGIDPTLKQFKTIGSVALIFNQEMRDVLDGFVGMNKRTLRSLGIDIDRTGEKAIIQSGNIRKVVDKDSQSIRTALIEIWQERFPDLLEKASSTTKAKVAIMKSNFLELRDSIGKKLLPTVNKLVDGLAKIAAGVRKTIDPTVTDKLENYKSQLASANSQLATMQRIFENPVWARRANVTQKDIDALKMRITILKATITDYKKLQVQEKTLGGVGQLGTEDLEKANKERLEKQKQQDKDELKNLAFHLKQYRKLMRERLKVIKDLNKAEKQLRDLDFAIKLEDTKKQVKAQRKFVSDMTNATLAITDEVFTTFADENKKMRDLLKSTLILLLDYLAKKVIIAQISASLDAAIKSAGGLLAPAAIAEAMAKIAAVNILFSTAKAAVASFANGTGGALQYPTRAVVGERGREIVDLPAGASVRPNNDRSLPQTNFNVYVTGVVSTEQGREVAFNIYEGMRDLERKGKLQKGLLL